MAFLFSDTQIINESFVEDINNMLNSGEVPNIFANDERVVICEVYTHIHTYHACRGRGRSRSRSRSKASTIVHSLRLLASSKAKSKLL